MLHSLQWSSINLKIFKICMVIYQHLSALKFNWIWQIHILLHFKQHPAIFQIILLSWLSFVSLVSCSIFSSWSSCNCCLFITLLSWFCLLNFLKFFLLSGTALFTICQRCTLCLMPYWSRLWLVKYMMLLVTTHS